MSYTKFLSEDIEFLKKEIDELKSTISDLSSEYKTELSSFEGTPLQNELNKFEQRIDEHANRIKSIVSDINNNVEDDSLALYLNASVNALQTEVYATIDMITTLEEDFDKGSPSDSYDTNVNITRPALSKIKSWIQKYIIPFLQRIMAAAWKILSTLLTPKSWSLKGKVGTGFLGLADVEMQINFGK